MNAFNKQSQNQNDSRVTVHIQLVQFCQLNCTCELATGDRFLHHDRGKLKETVSVSRFFSLEQKMEKNVRCLKQIYQHNNTGKRDKPSTAL